MEPVSATEAKRRFSRLLDGIRRGRTYLVTGHGQPVAKLSPVGGARKSTARKALLRRLRKQPRTRVGPWTGDEPYEEDL